MLIFAFRNDVISGLIFCSNYERMVITMKNQKLLALVEGAVMVALATVLCFIRLIKFPWGGSVTLLSMLPITLYSIRRGPKWGLIAAFAFSLIQFLQGVMAGLFGWGLTGVMLIMCILFDYIIAFTVLGLAGIFGNKSFGKMVGGTVLAIFLRYVSHVISGAAVWHSVGNIWEAFYTENEWVYSIIYNGVYMGIELILTVAVTVLLLKLPQTKQFFTAKAE